MKSLVILFTLSLLTFSAGAQRVKRLISIGPATLNFTLGAGQSAKQIVTIHNKMNKPYSFTLDFNDWTLDTAGEDIFFPMGAEPNSCANWITLDKTIVDVPANSKSNIVVTMKVPDSASAAQQSRWTMLNISTISEKKANANMGNVNYGANKTYTVGVRICQTPKSSTTVTKEMRMRKFYELPDTTKNNYRIECLNQGSIMLRCNFSMELSSLETGEKMIVGPKEALVLPGLIRHVDLKIPDTVKKGKYTAIALVDAQDDDIPLEAAQADIEIK